MRSLGNTVARLSALRKEFRPSPLETSGRLAPLADFGSNPGALRAASFVPDDLALGAALVVVLHGCTQNAAGYDRGSGWSELAERHGFALLYPEQQRSNNSNLCFNWYAAADARRGRGEAQSIRNMVRAMVERNSINPGRVFVTGLSAGGAMTAVMLAAYPDLFAGGAVIAGLPFGTANSLPAALERMRGSGLPDEPGLGALVRSASPHRGPWPTLSVWHGTGDAIVDPANGDALVAQWRSLHGPETLTRDTVQVTGGRLERWRDQAGRIVIEKYSLPGLGHGTPLHTGEARSVGRAGPHMLEAGISSTARIAGSWGLTDQVVERTSAPPPRAPAEPAAARPRAPTAGGVGEVIEKALRQAGLMR